MRAFSRVLRVGGKRLNAIAAMSLQGVEDIYIAEGTVNGDVFEDFIVPRTTCDYYPCYNPFNG